MQRIYCLSGLGADHRIFSGLQLPGYELVPLPWLLPEKEEPIATYASRLSVTIKDDHPILLGVSFGGMMALEIGKGFPDARVILVSSVKSRIELPRWMRLCGLLRLGSLTPSRRKEWTKRLQYYFLGTETAADKQLCDEFRQQTNPLFLRWAIRQVLDWKNDWQPMACYHIHGTKDRTFPIQRVHPTHIIRGGGHFMVSNRAEEVSRLLAGILA